MAERLRFKTEVEIVTRFAARSSSHFASSMRLRRIGSSSAWNVLCDPGNVDTEAPVPAARWLPESRKRSFV
jgi:hypothetical protein